MGDHDQAVLHDEDAHQSVTDDGRTLRPVRGDEYSVVGGFGALPLFRPPSDSSHVFLFRGEKLVPETLDIHDVHSGQFNVTEWESLYSSVFTLGGSNFSRATFAPIVDDSWRVVGHVGWADGNDILVPEDTVRDNRLFWSNLQKVRLDESRRQILDMFDQGRGTIPYSPFPPPAMSPPPAKDAKRWRGPETCVYRPHPSYRPTILEEARSGPLKETEIDQYLHNLDKFVKGGGEAFVGRHFLKPGYASYLDLHPSGLSVGGVGEPRKPFSSAYEFLVLVSPDGHLQGVMDIQSSLKTQVEWDTEVFLGAIDLAMTITMIIDIVPVAVILFRLGSKIATQVTIRAIKLVVDREAKALLKLAEKEAIRLVRGAMTGPERAEAKTAWAEMKRKFWDAGKVPPRRRFSEAEVKEWNKKIADRMSELGIPKKNQGAGVRRLPPPGEKPPPGGGKMRPFEDENGKAFNPTGSTRGGNYRSSPVDQYGGTESGISVHGNVFDRWEGFKLWNDPSTSDWDRIDAIIAHEWSEFNGLTHWETVELMPETKLPISRRAKELSRQMMIMGGEPEMAFTEFNKEEWKAIVDAGKATASFEEKKAAAAAVKAKK